MTSSASGPRLPGPTCPKYEPLSVIHISHLSTDLAGATMKLLLTALSLLAVGQGAPASKDHKLRVRARIKGFNVSNTCGVSRGRIRMVSTTCTYAP